MSEYQTSIIAIAKIKEQTLSYNQTHKLMNLGDCNKLEDLDVIDAGKLLSEILEKEITKDDEPADTEIALLPNPYYLEIREDPYEFNKDENGKLKRGTLYLFKELCAIPSNAVEMENLEKHFRHYEEFIYMDTFEVKSINWYNGADMPLFEKKI